MIEVVIASSNAGKIREILEIMAGLPIRFRTADDVKQWPKIEESGRTYVENALIKAVAVSKVTDRPALADDSGLEVDALDGLPGVRSARFAGPQATDDQNNVRLASLLHGVPPERRRARYRCAAVLWAPQGLRAEDLADGPGTGMAKDRTKRVAEVQQSGGTVHSAREGDALTLVEVAACEGWIATEPKGGGGFGYDPWFIPDGESRTMAELTEAEKNAISHRGKAFRGLKRQLQTLAQKAAEANADKSSPGAGQGPEGPGA